MLSGRAAEIVRQSHLSSTWHLTGVTRGQETAINIVTLPLETSKLLTPIVNNAVVQDPLGVSQEGFRAAVHLLFCILGEEAREQYDH